MKNIGEVAAARARKARRAAASENKPIVITAARLREVLHRNPDTGVFTWRVRNSNRVKVGDIAGDINGAGYRRIGIDGKRYLAHRLAWLWMTGEWPEEELDHIDGSKADNRIPYLRQATRSENGCNMGLRSDNTSGFKGVTWNAARRKWKAQIMVNGRHIHLGYFDNPVHAAVAHRQAALKYHGEFAPGTLPPVGLTY